MILKRWQNFFLRNAWWIAVVFIAGLYGSTAAWVGSDSHSFSSEALVSPHLNSLTAKPSSLR